MDEPSEIDEDYVTLVRVSKDENGNKKESDQYTGKWEWKNHH